MTFKVLHQFKHGLNTFEAGNSYNPENYENMSESVVNVFHNAGWIELEGKENNNLNPSHSEVIADNVSSNTTTSNVGAE